MRIREDGKHGHRTETIEEAVDFWDCNKTTALMQSAEFSCCIHDSITEVLSRNDLTIRQKREIAETLSVTGYYTIKYDQSITVEF